MCPHLHVMCSPATYLTPSHSTFSWRHFALFQMVVLKPENDVVLLLVPNCSLTHELGEWTWGCICWTVCVLFLISLSLSLTCCKAYSVVKLPFAHPWLVEIMIYPLYFVMHALLYLWLLLLHISSVKHDGVMLALGCHGANVGCALLPEFCLTRYWRKFFPLVLVVITSGLFLWKAFI